ncbi:MAG: alpha-glucan family phosphorylase [bacterium]|nr:alpha-glucan family phosphorylase [bacterium]
MNKENSKEEVWFREFKKGGEYETFVKHPVAYFSAEYALDSTLPTYAGGLGILAGDFVRETAMQDFPLVAVGLRYRKAQSALSLEGKAEHNLKKVADKNGKEIIVSFPLENRIISAKAWHWQEGHASVYLLDTGIEENTPEDRKITENLYDENRDTRLKQEIILGICGFRLLARLGIHASVYHLNEGHSAFLALELVRHEMEHQRVSFENACEYARKHIVFTNHTLVPAGQEQFLSEKVALFMGQYAEEMGLEGKDIADLGAINYDSNLLSMTTLSFRLSAKSNTVSRLHLQKAKNIWPDQKMENITNGIFIARWDKIKNASLENIWEKHLENKKNLLKLIKEKTGEIWGETDLIFAWGRRMVDYKQPLLFIDNTDKILEIAKKSPVTIRIIFSGPTGENESPFVEKIKKTIEEKLKGVAVFIPNYNTDIAATLTAGTDIWLNTPIIGREACGTSGMKAALNGTLTLSTNDGWVHEINGESIGWVVNGSQNGEELRAVVEKSIIPLCSEHLKNPKGSEWTKKMGSARKLILENFSTTRMLKEYIEKLYIPTLKQKHAHERK